MGHMETFLVILSIGAFLSSAASQPADSEGASFSTMPEYVQWVTKSYGDPANTKKPECLDLKSKLCGARDTSEVLCLAVSGGSTDSGPKEARFRSASRYTRVGYLRCSLTQLKCNTDPESYTGPAKSVDPVSLAAWVQYMAKCNTWVEPKTPEAECKRLKEAHCSRPDVKCGTNSVEFKDLGSKKTVLRGDNIKGLAYLV